MLGLCTICGCPVLQNKQYCPGCQAELDAAYAAREREIEADNREIEAYLKGENIEHRATQSNPVIGKIAQPARKHTGNRRTSGGK